MGMLMRYTSIEIRRYGGRRISESADSTKRGHKEQAENKAERGPQEEHRRRGKKEDRQQEGKGVSGIYRVVVNFSKKNRDQNQNISLMRDP